MTAATAEPDTASNTDTTRQLPLFEGKRVTGHRINFSGNNKLEELELVKASRLDKEVTFVVRGRVASKGYSTKRDEHGNVIETIEAINISVESITSYDAE